MPLAFNNDRWEALLILLNQKRVIAGFSTISHTFSDWVKQSDIDCLRNGTIDILYYFGYTLATALTAAGYGYSTWKTWDYNWIAEVSLDEIENILNLLTGVTQISVHVHSPEGKEIGSVMYQDYNSNNSVSIYVDNIFEVYGAYNVETHPRYIEVSAGDREVKATFNGMTLTQNVHVDNGQTLIVTFNFTRIETFDLIAWLDSTTPTSSNLTLDVDIPPRTGVNSITFEYLNNAIVRCKKNPSYYNQDYSFIAHVLVNADIESILTSSIFHTSHEGVAIWTSPPGSILGSIGYGLEEYRAISNINIPPQSFLKWYIGHNSSEGYPSLRLGTGPSSAIAINSGGITDRYTNFINASLYDTIFIQGGNQGLVDAGHTYSDYGENTHSSSWVGFMDDYFFSSIPKDLTGLAV